jgi:hypothetical protein
MDEVLSLGAEQPKLGPPALLLELPDGLELLVIGRSDHKKGAF